MIHNIMDDEMDEIFKDVPKASPKNDINIFWVAHRAFFAAKYL